MHHIERGYIYASVRCVLDLPDCTMHFCLHNRLESSGHSALLLFAPNHHTAVFCFRLNSFPPRQNGYHFADDIFKRIFLNENVSVSIQFSVKFGPKGPLNQHWFRSWLVACSARSHYLGQWCQISLTHKSSTRGRWVKVIDVHF